MADEQGNSIGIRRLGARQVYSGLMMGLLTLVIPFAAAAEDYIVRDNFGRRLETVREREPDLWIRQDPLRRTLGLIERRGERLQLKSLDGRITGQLDTINPNRAVIRDTLGRPLGQAERRSGQGLILRDPFGTRRATVQPR